MIIDNPFKAQNLKEDDLICMVRLATVGNVLLQKDTILRVQTYQPNELRNLATKVSDLGRCSLLQTPHRFRTVYNNEVKDG